MSKKPNDVLASRVRLTGFVQNETALHIGIGRSLGVTGSDSPVLLDYFNNPVIPGSSFKGTLRANLEAVVRGLNFGKLLWTCDTVAHTNEHKTCCVRDKEDWDKADVILNNLCDMCYLFGAPYFGARLFISDMVVAPDCWLPQMLGVRDGVAIDRETRTASGGKKYDFETVPPGVRFKLDLVLDNPQDHEVGLLLRGFELYNEGFAFLGGKTSRGTGRISIRIETITRLDPVAFLKGEQTYRTVFGDGEWNHYYEALKTRLTPQE